MKKTNSLIVLAAALALVAAACSGDSSPDTTVTEPPIPDPINLAGTRWVATAMFLGGAPVAFVPNAEPTADFTDDGRSFGGSTGCNSFFGDYTAGGGTIAFGGLGQTEMACEEPLMRQEANVIQVFQDASLYTIENGILTIGQLGGSALQFQDRAIAFPDAELTGTLWLGDTLITGQAASTVAPGSSVTLQIDAAAGEARGNLSCNSYTASVEWDRTQLTFGQMSFTEMACVGGGIMEQEQFVLSVLQGELQVDIDGGRLTLTAANGDGMSFGAGSD